MDHEKKMRRINGYFANVVLSEFQAAVQSPVSEAAVR